MTHEELKHATPARYATFRALRPRLWMTVGMVFLAILVMGRLQRAAAETLPPEVSAVGTTGVADYATVR